MIKETELKYTVNTLVDLSRQLWGDNSTEFLASALQSVITDKQMKVLIDNLEQQVKDWITGQIAEYMNAGLTDEITDEQAEAIETAVSLGLLNNLQDKQVPT